MFQEFFHSFTSLLDYLISYSQIITLQQTSLLNKYGTCRKRRNRQQVTASLWTMKAYDRMKLESIKPIKMGKCQDRRTGSFPGNTKLVSTTTQFIMHSEKMRIKSMKYYLPYKRRNHYSKKFNVEIALWSSSLHNKRNNYVSDRKINH